MNKYNDGALGATGAGKGGFRRFFAGLAAIMGLGAAVKPYTDEKPRRYSDSAFQPIEKKERNRKDPKIVMAIERRRRAKKLARLSKPKRRQIYYYNLHHSPKMYAMNG